LIIVPDKSDQFQPSNPWSTGMALKLGNEWLMVEKSDDLKVPRFRIRQNVCNLWG